MESTTTPRGWHKKIVLALLVALAIVGAFWMGAKYEEKRNSANNRGNILRLGPKKYTNPALLCNIAANDEAFTELKPMKKVAETFINNQIKADNVSRISVYFHALNSGRWFGINENEKFIPASLFKVPILITYLKEAESAPSLLQTRLTYTKNFDGLVKNFGSEPTLENGKSYAIKDLLEKMVIESDNTPLFLLAKYLNQNVYNDLFTLLQIPIPKNPQDVQDVDFLSTKDFSKFFRILYSSTYLSQDLSEQALDILVRADFPQGLQAGLPTDTVLAHKFGVRTINAAGPNNKQLHDCGIIYYPDHPYFLCVMTEGSDFNKMETSIQMLSKLIYGEVPKLYQAN